MSSRLREILARVPERVTRALDQRDELVARARDRAPAADLRVALRREAKGSSLATALRVIGELKRRSPSAGSIREDLDAPAVAVALEAAGCAALSVLTEPEFFGGSLATLAEVRERVALPLLRKDFLIHPIQVVEARAHGADAVLLLAAALDDDGLRRCADAAQEWGMQVLAEAHGEQELDRLLALGFPVVGLNARDLNTFEVDLDRALRWCERVPTDRITVAESGVRTREAAQQVVASAADAILVGEGLMRPGTPAERFETLFGEAGHS